jgi:hypothetical protein
LLPILYGLAVNTGDLRGWLGSGIPNQPFALEVQYGAFCGELKMSGDGSGDVVTGLPALSCFACTGCEPLAVALLAFDDVRHARRFICGGVRAKFDDPHKRFANAGFVDCIL